MTEYTNENRAALWKNDKRTTEKHPQLRGTATVDGKEYWVSAWTSKEGGNKPLVSMSFTLKEDVQAAPAAPVEDFTDDIPF